MHFTNAMNPYLLITQEEEEMLRPTTIEELDGLMNELEKQKYPRTEVCIPTLVFQEPATPYPTTENDASKLTLSMPTPSVKVLIKPAQALTPTKSPFKPIQTPDKALRPKRTRTTPAPSPSNERKRGIPIPKSWETASSEDLLLFKLKENGGSWMDISAEWNRISGLEYAARTLSNRWNKITSTLGTPPEKVWDLDASMFL
ncbi:uncharacterized protein N7498_003012 [Penicillium cinerascens]|uniref:Myb-like domain-containing protein n=1 Tax=Penicillium cinerascens TaxID=70096 RepID=A0A9W9TCH7_9EURO|nr:uncharacterized protein N7498_003012 [Penicillium cinerascens]KAJ5216605.1 hypothetical protein N7498_003012 [Penicillium cinerascens]